MWASRVLETLDYPRASTFQLSDASHLAHAVAWIEDRKVRPRETPAASRHVFGVLVSSRLSFVELDRPTFDMLTA